MRIIMLCLGLMVSGCATNSAYYESERRRVDDDLKKSVEKYWADAESILVSPSCENKIIVSKKKELALNAQNCGLLTKEIFQTNLLQSEVCTPLKIKGQECKNKTREAFFARLGFRYKEANFLAVDKYCTAYPSQCSDLETYEIKLAESHNESVLADLEKKIERKIDDGLLKHISISDEMSAEQEQRRGAVMNAFGGFGETLRQSTQTDYKCMSRCTSSGSTHQFCQSKCSY